MARFPNFGVNNDDMEQISDLAAWVKLCREGLNKQGATIWEVCNKAGIPKGTAHAYHKILTGATTRPEATTMLDMAKLCGVDLFGHPAVK